MSLTSIQLGEEDKAKVLSTPVPQRARYTVEPSKPSIDADNELLGNRTSMSNR